MTVTVCLPVFNEEANLATLLDTLLADDAVEEILAVDDCSSDASPRILANYASRDARIAVARHKKPTGQLAAWVQAARASRSERLVFVDAAARPARGAVERLARMLTGNAVLASGRVIPSGVSARTPGARFYVSAIHRVRSLGYAKHAIVARFFAADRAWLLQAAKRTDIIASDVYLSCLAHRQGYAAIYVPEAVCYSAEPQRKRDDAGYAQLRAMRLLTRDDEPRVDEYLGCFVAQVLSDPLGAAAWVRDGISARMLRPDRRYKRECSIRERSMSAIK